MDICTVFRYENSIGTIDFAFDSPFWITNLAGVSAVTVQLMETQSTGQVGSTLCGQSVQPRSITVDGCLMGELAQTRRQLLTVMAPGVPARLYKIDGNSACYLEVVPLQTPEIAPGEGVQPFQMQLYAAYPYWKSTKENATQLSGLKALFGFPFFTGDAFRLSVFNDSYYCAVHNDGNVPVGFELVFAARAQVKNPEVYHMATRRRIALNKTMVAGEVASIGTHLGQIEVRIKKPDNTEENGFRYVSADSDLFMTLLPGENLLRTDAELNREALSAVLRAPVGVFSGV